RRRHGSAAARAAAVSRHGSVPQRALVLLSRALVRAGGSDMTSKVRGPSAEVRRVLLLSHTTGYQLRAFDEAAGRLGIELVFATDRCNRLHDPWQDHAVPVRFHDLDHSLAAIAGRARQSPIHGVLAVGDRPVPLAARAADALGLPWH